MDTKTQFIEKSKPEIEDLIWKIMVGSATGNIEPNDKGKFVDELVSKLSECWDMAGEEKEFKFEDLVTIAKRILDEKYREDIFTGESGDIGPKFIVQFRKLVNSLTSKQEDKK